MFRFIVITLSCLSILSAQEAFLDNVTAEDILLLSIEQVPVHDISAIEYNEMQFWFGPSQISALSPDSTLLVEVRCDKITEKVNGIWLINTKNGQEIQISEGVCYELRWSHTGKFLAYVKINPTPDDMGRKTIHRYEELYTFNVETNENICLISTPGRSIEYEWSPVDNYIAFLCSPDNGGHFGLYAYSQTNNLMKLDSLASVQVNFSWSPNGQMLAYVFPEEVGRGSPGLNLYAKASEVYIINRDGTGKTRITDTPQAEQFAKWHPSGKQILTKSVDGQYSYVVLAKREKK